MRYRWFDYVIPTLLVAASAAAVHYGVQAPNDGPPEAAERAKVIPGKDYYVFVKLVEVTETDEHGGAWDSANESAPDLFAEIHWRGQRVFRSSTRSDSLLAKWSAAEIDLRQMALTGEKASLEGFVKAARINVVQGEAISISVIDEDPLGVVLIEGDSAGSFEIQTSELLLGEQTFLQPTKAIKRIVIVTASMDAPPEVFQ